MVKREAVVTMDDIRAAAGGRSRQAISAWVDAGLIPPPKIVRGPSGRGRRGVWPAAVLDRVRVICDELEQGGTLEKAMTGDGIYKMLKDYSAAAGIEIEGLCLQVLRATAATNALDHDSDIAKVQEWLGHSNISTTRLYDRRRSKPEDSPTSK